jgi:L-lactate dehydrogenase complex protein LldF
MESTSHAFRENVQRALQDPNLRKALDKARGKFIGARLKAAARLPEFEALRDRARDIKDDALANLDHYLERFEERVTERGGHVHWCADALEAREAILSICHEAKARTVTKGKTMVAEEIGLNPFLERSDIEPIETDLGEYIIQLAKQPPSHIIAPAVHMTKEQVSDLFLEHHTPLGMTRRLEEARELVDEARKVLRQKYFNAEVGITGANFLIAETGSGVIVTNEGNGDLTQTLPRVHVVLAGIEKIVPTLEDATTLLRVLARSATGQEFSAYTTFYTGPRRPGDLDGPEEFHVVLVDNGRSSMLGTDFQPMLRCIRCGACLNHCPIYNAIGGHAYGWVYAGPMGKVLTPALIGLAEARDLPNACTLNGRCNEVCPVRIPLTDMIRHWREEEFDEGLTPRNYRWGLRVWSWFARRPGLYRLGANVGMRVLGALGRGKGRFRSLPLAGGWTTSRDMPAPEGRTFLAQWRERQGGGNRDAHARGNGGPAS